MDMNKPIKQLNDEDLQIEFNTLIILRNGLQCFIPQDEATTGLLHETECRLIEAKIERNSRWGSLT